MLSQFDTIYSHRKTFPLFPLIVLAIFFHPLAFPKDCDCKNNQGAQLASAMSDIEDVARGDKYNDPRKQIAEIELDSELKKLWPEVSKMALSGVQSIYCGDSRATAFLACDGKTIVTNAHAILDQDNRVNWDPKSRDKDKRCELYVEKPNGKYAAYKISTMSRDDLVKQERLGTIYPNTTGQEGNDWAVLSLEVPVNAEYAKPLRFAEFSNANKILGRDSIFAAASFSDFKVNGKKPRAYQVCKGLKALPAREGGSSIETNCKSERGSSGGPLSVIQENELLVTSINSDFLRDYSKIRTTDGSVIVPVEGKLKESILKHSDSKNCFVPLRSKSEHVSL